MKEADLHLLLLGPARERQCCQPRHTYSEGAQKGTKQEGSVGPEDAGKCTAGSGHCDLKCAGSLLSELQLCMSPTVHQG